MSATKPTIQTLFFWCNDVAAMRRFYTDLIGLTEVGLSETWSERAVQYEVSDGVSLFFLRAKGELPTQTEWAIQPAFSWEGQAGTAAIPSWQLNVPPQEFDAIVSRLLDAGAEPYRKEPGEWEGAKQFFARDPMGNTVEIYCDKAKE